MYIVDDQTTYGKYLADVVEAQFKKLGGTVVKHDGAGTNVSDYTSLLTAAKALNPDVVFYGGVTSTGGGVLRKQMVANGMGALPFIGGDGISDGAASVASSFLNIAGDQGDVGTWMTVAGAHDIPDRATLAAAYKTEFGAELGAYSAAAYACTQVYLQALKAVGPDREKISRLRDDYVQLVRHRTRQDRVRCKRRHQPAHHQLLPVRSDYEGLEVRFGRTTQRLPEN